ncbi:MAG TPA: carboxypeptidase regulatory-like domain-containing protein [Candidatus Saccharimonadales bacterium]|nr:carboxypeptidase regulatory-like domain-containing protein [Candidatus Saccharimonadales bacterium]
MKKKHKRMEPATQDLPPPKHPSRLRIVVDRFQSKGRIFRALVFVLVFAAFGSVLLFALAAPESEAPVNQEDSGIHLHAGPHGEIDQNVCSTKLTKGQVRCLAALRIDAKAKTAKPKGKKSTGVTPSGVPSSCTDSTILGNCGAYDPSYIQSAYNLSAASASKGIGQTVAIVDAYDNPRAETDLAAYRDQFGLPPCTTANGCFRKVDQSGGSNYPIGGYAWAAEESLDIQMVSAVCPNCHLLLVEATTNSYEDLAAAENEAVALGANVVSNSWGGSYVTTIPQIEPAFTHPGVAITASSGDDGYFPQYPSGFPSVTAVGGTTLAQTGNTGGRNATETAWNYGGSGCSYSEAKPAWQHDSCASRTAVDVAAVADPATGVWVYDTRWNTGWSIYGGTSAAAPIIAAVYALNQNPTGTTLSLNSTPYGNSSALFDITSGCNASVCGQNLTTAGPGYDGPTGMGVPNGIAAFSYLYGVPFSTTSSPTPPPAPDTTAPSAASILGVVVTSPSQATLSWTAATDNVGVDHYDVYVGNTKLNSATNPSFGLTGLRSNTNYTYYVIAVDAAGNRSVNSTKFSFKTPNISAGKGSLTGTLMDASTGKNISGKVSYRLSSATSTKSVNTNSTGYFVINSLIPGAYTITLSRTGYISQVITVSVLADQTVVQNGSLGQ